jgi:hypothetical protein
MTTLLTFMLFGFGLPSQSDADGNLLDKLNNFSTAITSAPQVDRPLDIERAEVVYFDAPPRPYDAIIRR